MQSNEIDESSPHHILNNIAKMIDSNTISTTLNEVVTPINACNLRKAQAQLEEGKTIGKIVLEKFG